MTTWDAVVPAGPAPPAPGPEPDSTADLHPDDPMPRAALAVLRCHLDRARYFEPGVRAGRDPEDVHRMRVSIRRMRAALRVFAHHLPGEQARALRKELRRAGAVLGAVRDLDVFRAGAAAWQDTTGADLAGLIAAWGDRYRVARTGLVAYLDGPRRIRLAAALDALDAAAGERGPAVSRRVPELVAGHLDELLGFAPIARAAGPALDDLHRLRISAKRLRYLLEFFAAALDADATEEALTELKSLQDRLGALNDAAVARDLLLGYLRCGSLVPAAAALPGPAPTAPDAARYLAAVETVVDDTVSAVPAAWERIAAPRFGELLARALAHQ